jgi:hypothetical protein
MSVPTGFTDYPRYVDRGVNRFPGFIVNQATFIISMETAGVFGSTYWANTVFNTEVIQELFEDLKCRKGYKIQLAKDCKFSYHNFVVGWNADFHISS